MVSRELPELLELASRHLRLLKVFSHEAFNNGNPDYVGEVAGKLRLLVSDEGSNTPLLLKLLAIFDVDDHISLVGPGQERRVSLSDFLKEIEWAHKLSTGEMLELTKVDIVKTFAEKFGASHVDWTLPDAFHEVLQQKITFNGIDAIAWQIRSVANAVLEVGGRLLGQLTKDNVREKTIERIKRRSCQSPGDHNRKGVLLAELGEMGQAIRCFRTAVDGEATNIPYRINLGMALMNAGRLEDAENVFATILVDSPDHTDALGQYGLVFARQKQFDKAIEQYTHVINLQPRNAEALHDRGVCHLEAQDIDRAAADFDAAIKLHPASPQSNYSLAAVRCLQGRYEESLALLERVKELGGWKNFSPLRDPDFTALVSEPTFQIRLEAMFGANAKMT